MKNLCLGALFSFSLLTLSSNALANREFFLNNNWMGPYFGLSFGSGGGNNSTSFSTNINTHVVAEDVGGNTITDTTTLKNASLSGNSTGSTADLLIGYNLQSSYLPQVVFGGQLEGNFFNNISLNSNGTQSTNKTVSIADGVTVDTTITNTTEQISINNSINSMFTFLGRAGYLLQPNLLVYFLAGGVEADITTTILDISSEDANKWVLGYTVGAGLEYNFNNNWSLRGEYRYINFNYKYNDSENFYQLNDPDGPNNLTTTTTVTNNNSHSNINFNMGMFSVVYKFA